MSNPQYPGDPQNPYNNDQFGQPSANQWSPQQPANQWEQQQGNSSWEQSQPTGNVWNQQATDAWGAQPPPPPQGGFQSPMASSSDAKGFFGALFDFSFNSYITNKVIKLVYIAFTVLSALALLFAIVSSFMTGNGLIIVMAILLYPLFAILGLAFFRMSLEMYHAIIRISEDVHDRLPRA